MKDVDCNLFGTQCITWLIYFNYIICAFNQARMNEKNHRLVTLHPNYFGGAFVAKSGYCINTCTKAVRLGVGVRPEVGVGVDQEPWLRTPVCQGWVGSRLRLWLPESGLFAKMLASRPASAFKLSKVVGFGLGFGFLKCCFWWIRLWLRLRNNFYSWLRPRLRLPRILCLASVVQ